MRACSVTAAAIAVSRQLVEEVKFLDRHRRPTLLRERGSCTNTVTSVRRLPLRERETGCEQLRAMPRRCLSDRVGTRWGARRLESKGLFELLEKERDTMLDLAVRPRWPHTPVSSLTRARNDRRAIG
jgi:hypothetical protein